MDNQPYGRSIFEEAYTLIDPKTCFPYSHSIIGSMDDLQRRQDRGRPGLLRSLLRAQQRHAGRGRQLRAGRREALIEQYFGSIPRNPRAIPPVACDQQFATGPVRRRVEDKNANLPAVMQIFRMPAYDNPDYPALELLSAILGQGESYRLNRVLARETKLAAAAPVLLNPFGPRRGPGELIAFAVANQGVALDSLDHVLSAELARVASGVSDSELVKARNLYRTSVITGRQTPLAVAEALQSADLFLGSPDAVNTDFARHMAVTGADIRRVAAQYLRPENSLTLLVSAEAAK